jgi:hypothetical protein
VTTPSALPYWLEPVVGAFLAGLPAKRCSFLLLPAYPCVHFVAGGGYYRAIYGEVPDDPSAYPWCVGERWIFYQDLVTSVKVTDLKSSVGACPTQWDRIEGQYDENNNTIPPPNTMWSW